MTKEPVELLAPAGSIDAFRAAAAAGADAVYLGAKGFNARAQAQNFSDGELITAIDDAHVQGMKVYLVLNTLIGENEIQEAAMMASFAYREGIDGIIVQDLGLVSLLRKIVPQMPIHASTQMTIHNIDGVRAAQKLGLSRVVLSRELSVEEIREITEKTDIQVEVFIHGALCISRSGQCLLSSFIGGRSGNRGRCAQPCRLPWKNDKAGLHGDYLLSPRDLMTLELLPDLISAGISSLKIEGRMKSPEYVAAAVMVYRKYLDLAMSNPTQYRVDQQDIRMLEQVFNRGGFTTGYLQGRDFRSLMSTEHPKHWGVPVGKVLHPDGDTRSRFSGSAGDRLARIKFSAQTHMGDGLEIRDAVNSNPSAIVSVMMKSNTHVKTAYPGDSLLVGNFKMDPVPGSLVYKTYDKELMTFLTGFTNKQTQRVPVSGQFYLMVGEKPSLKVWDSDGNTVSVEGEASVQAAEKKAFSSERAADQLKKTADTPYYFHDLKIITDNRSYIPVAVINGLRRQALDFLSDRRKSSHKRVNPTQNYFDLEHFPGNTPKLTKKRGISLYFYRAPQSFNWEGLRAERVYLPITEPEMFDTAKTHGVGAYAWLPSVLSDRQMDAYVLRLGSIQKKLDGILVGNPGILYRMREAFPGLPVVLDFQMNVFNSLAIETVKEFEPASVTLSLELSMESITQIKSPEIPLEVYVYGEIPVMLMEYCPSSDQGSCVGKCGSCQRTSGYLIDRLGKHFLYETDPALKRTTLFNSSRMMLEDTCPLLNSDVVQLRIGIMDECSDDIHELCRFYHEQWVEGRADAKLDPSLMEKLKKRGLTRGHFYRGVE